VNTEKLVRQLDKHVETLFDIIHEATAALGAMVEVCERNGPAVRERDHWLSEAAGFLAQIPAVIEQEYLHCLHLTVLDAGKTMGRIVEACAGKKTPLVSIWTAWLQKAEAAVSSALRTFQRIAGA
jgi:hypothetical protein